MILANWNLIKETRRFDVEKYSQEELVEVLQVINSTINQCEKIHPKFAEGTAQHTLLKNRIKALYISKALITDDKGIGTYVKEDLAAALPPVLSIINKCEKAQLKCSEGTSSHTRLKKIIKSMYLSKELIIKEMDKIDNLKE